MAKSLTVKTLENLKPGPARKEVPDGLVRGLFFVLQPTGKTGWAVRYRHSGKTRKLTLGTFPAIDLKSARELASRALVAVAGGEDPAAEKQAGKALRPADDHDLVERVAQKFVERYCKATQKASTAYESERILNREIVSVWRGRKLSEIRKSDVFELLDGIVDRGSPIQANRTLAVISKLCNWCVERGLITTSPAAGVRAPAPARSRDRVLADDELVAVWKASGALGGPFGPPVQLLILTGQRRGEVAGMRWEEVDFNARTWTLPRERAKNGREHAVPLSDAALEILKSLPRVSSKGGFVFTTNATVQISGFQAFKARLDAALPPDMPAWTIHDLRRSFASGCARLGIDLHVVEKVLNHVSGSFGGIVSVYQKHTFADEKRAAMDAWGRYVAQLVSGEPGDNVVQLSMSR